MFGRTTMIEDLGIELAGCPYTTTMFSDLM
jgi:hypothetical protein